MAYCYTEMVYQNFKWIIHNSLKCRNGAEQFAQYKIY